MLKIFSHDTTEFEEGIALPKAYNVCVTSEINGNRMLKFLYPTEESADLICENKIVACEGQAYRIVSVTRKTGESPVTEAVCYHVYNADAPNVHLQNIPDMIGVNPSKVISRAFAGSAFSLFSDSELAQMGMRRVDYDGFEIDFFSTDKTNPYDVVTAVIESCGKGEIYADNYKIALVERIGSDTALRLDLSKNMKEISIERDITDMVTRLYPYGKDDAHIGSVNGNVQYIQSSNADIYGVREGYRDYSDYTEPDKIMCRALWEFDSENADRIDVPCVNITGSYVDISKLTEFKDEKISIGDTVTVIDNGNEISERVIKLEYYPYQNDSTVISIGRVKKDLFFYLEQMGTLTRRYSKVSTSNGKVKAQAVAGVISNSGIEIKSDSGALSILSDMLNIEVGNILKACIGNRSGNFVCDIMDNNGKKALTVGVDGKMYFTGDVSADEITVGENVITTNENGELCINGKRIVTEEEAK